MRLRLPTPGLVGSPHVHSSCLGPVSFAGMSTYLRLQAPRAFAQVFAHCRFVYKKRSGSPTGSRPKALLLFLIVYRPPRGGGARSGIPPYSSGRSSLYLFYFSYTLCIASGYTPPFLLCVYPLGRPAILLSVSTAVHSLQCGAWPGLTSSLPFLSPSRSR